MKDLILEKRGCNFKEMHASTELEKTGLENFRLFGYINMKKEVEEKRGNTKTYAIEICTNEQHNKYRNGIYSFIRGSYQTAGNCWGAVDKDGQIRNPNKKELVKYINEKYNTNYSNIIIVENL